MYIPGNLTLFFVCRQATESIVAILLDRKQRTYNLFVDSRVPIFFVRRRTAESNRVDNFEYYMNIILHVIEFHPRRSQP